MLENTFRRMVFRDGSQWRDPLLCVIGIILLLIPSVTKSQAQLPLADHLLDSLENQDVFDSEDILLVDSIIAIYSLEQLQCKVIEAQNLKGRIFQRTTAYDQAVSTLRNIIYHFPAECDSLLLLEAYKELSATYMTIENYSSVDSIYSEVKSEFGSRYVKSTPYHGLLLNKGNAFYNSGELKQAEYTYRELLNARRQHLDSAYLQELLNNLGAVYGEQGLLDSAQTYFLKALQLARKRNQVSKTIKLLTNLGIIESYRNRPEHAVNMFDSALSLADAQNDLKAQSAVVEEFAVFYSRQGQYENAFRYMDRHADLKDSILNAEKIRAVAEAEQKYEMERRKRQIQELKVRNLNSELQKNYFIMGGIVLLLLSAGLWWRMEHSRKAKREIEKEKDRSDRLLLNILPEEIAEELKATGKYNARRHSHVSIMFADFKDFTQTSEQMNAEELVDEIDYCFRAFDELCASHQLEKIKTIGDCYMVAAGLPVEQDEDTKHIVEAALKMQEFLHERKMTREQRGQIGFDMRIGIHTGPVVAGVVGSDKFSYDIWGDTVNTASRMESSGEVGKVNISRETYQLIKDEPEFRFEQRGKVYAKHKGEVEMYFVSKR